jgi:hypothetical protein
VRRDEFGHADFRPNRLQAGGLQGRKCSTWRMTTTDICGARGADHHRTAVHGISFRQFARRRFI